MADFSKITYNWDENNDFRIRIETDMAEIRDAVYSMEEGAFRSVVVERMRDLGYLVYEPGQIPSPFGFCGECGIAMDENSRKIDRVEIFCPNEECPQFVRCFWRDR